MEKVSSWNFGTPLSFFLSRCCFTFFVFPNGKFNHFFLIIVDDAELVSFAPKKVLFLFRLIEVLFSILKKSIRSRALAMMNFAHLWSKIEISLESVCVQTTLIKNSFTRFFSLSFFLPEKKYFMIIKQNVYDLDSVRLESSVVMCSMKWKFCVRVDQDANRSENFPWKNSLFCADQ